MQIILTFKVNHPVAFPYNYNYQVYSAIMKKLRKVGASDFFHDTGFSGDNGKKFKGFVFGKLLGEHSHIDNHHLVFTDTISLEVRSPVFEFCDALQRSFELNPTIELFDSNLELCGADLMNYHINSNSILCITASPVIVRSKGEALSPDNALFTELLTKNFEEKYKIILKSTPREIIIKPLGKHEKKVTLFKGKLDKPNKEEKEKNKDKNNGTRYNAYHGKYSIKGDNKTLEFLYNAGLGEKNSQGFGMLNVL